MSLACVGFKVYMVKYICMLLCMALCYNSPAQTANCNLSIKGRVIDDQGDADDVTIAVAETQQGTLSNEAGRFVLTGLCAGTVTIQVSHIGCETQVIQLVLRGDTSLKIKLEHSDVNLHEVSVTEAKIESHNTQSATELDAKTLTKLQGLSIGEMVEKIPGVYSLNTGATISKPVIHGLHSNRILIVNNGVRQESQQWGSEHAPEIDPYLAKKITVVKGANSLRYGSDAIGGVILLEPNPMPSKPGIGGEFNFAGFSNNAEGNFNLILEGNHSKVSALSWRVHGTYRRAGNSRAASYWLNNTGVEEGNASAAIAWKKEQYGFEAFYSHFQTRLGILSAAHVHSITDLDKALAAPEPAEQRGFSYAIGRPYQKIGHDLAKLKAYVLTGNKGTLTATFAWQNNTRYEYDKDKALNDSIAALNLPAFYFQIQTMTGDVTWQHNAVKGWSGQVGINFTTQTNNFKYAYFVPDFRNIGGGAFVAERFIKDRFELDLGIRFDYKWLSVLKRKNNKVEKGLYNFYAPSGNIGMEYHIKEGVKWNMNIGSAFRAPHPVELYAEGIHHGAATYEIGNKNMKPEQSIDVSTGINADTKFFKADVTLYSNLIYNFIWAKPVQPPTYTVRGAFPTYRYVQTNALLSGADVYLAVVPIKGLEVYTKPSLLFARNLTTRDWLEQMPPIRFDNGVNYTLRDYRHFKQTYFGIGVLNVLQQRFVPADYNDYAAPPKAYVLLNLQVGTTLQFGKQQVTVGLAIDNLLNQKYRDYMDRFRYFADERGTNVALRVNVPFFIPEKVKQK
ncbi:MAG: TonB-dependent receptor [Bacteroidetes bacterium]|nr:TonB-dependent receptor [Bacteroidota bacterium]